MALRPTTSLLASISLSPSHIRTRPLPLRKSHLYQTHLSLLTSSPTILFLRPSNFTSKEWRVLRASLPLLPSGSKSKLTVLRPGLLPALLRSEEVTKTLGKDARRYLEDESHLKGPLCALTLPELDPPTLATLLTILQKTSETPAENAPPPPPNSKESPVKEERLKFLSSLLELSKSFDKGETERVAKLPNLDGLRSQLVGLLSMPAGRLVGVLGARGSELGRTLEGLKEGLKEKESGAEVPAP